MWECSGGAVNLIDAFSSGFVTDRSLVPPDLYRRRPWHRFEGSNEADYQAWANIRIRHLSTVTIVSTIPAWPLIALLNRFVLDVRVPWSMFYLAAAVIPGAHFVWLWLLQHRRTRALAGTWVAFFEVVVGLLLLYGLRELYGFEVTGAEVYVPFAFAAFMAGMLVPFRSGVLGFSVLAGGGTYYLARDLSTGAISTAEGVLGILILWGTIYTIGILYLAVEVALRGTWAQEQVIERQQEELAESRRLISRYVPPDVVRHITEGHGESIAVPERRRVTILFSDVVGFTDLADKLDPESLTEVISDYLGTMAEVVEAHGGTLNEFAGDGFMAIFGAPGQMEPHAQVVAAVAAGREILARLPELNRRWARIGVHDPLRTRIGINTGMASVGTFGSDGRATYTAIGIQTNIAARIQAQSDPGEILLSESAYAHVEDLDLAVLKGEVTVKGVHFPLKVYSVAADVGERRTVVLPG